MTVVAIAALAAVAHNIGRGPELEDMLFDFEITGHYRWLGDPEPVTARPAP